MDVLRAKPGQGRELMVPGDAGRIVTNGLSRHAAEPSASPRPVGHAPEPRRIAPGEEDPVVARRRAWFLRLLGGTGVGLLLAIGFGGWLWLPFVMLVLVTGGYTALLRRLKLQNDRARRVVRDLDLRRPAAPFEVEEPPQQAVAGDELVFGTVRLRRWDA